MMLRKLLLFITILVSLHATQPTFDNVTKLYVATFNRAPDAAGLFWWLNKSNLDLEGIAQSFFDQTETKTLYPAGTTNRDFIYSVYQNLFNRSPDTLGWNYWEDKLNGTNNYGYNSNLDIIPKSLFILAAINGAKDTADGQDKTILENKKEAGLYFALYGYNGVDFARTTMQSITDTATTVTQVKNTFYDNSGTSTNDACIVDFLYYDNSTYSLCYEGVAKEICEQIKDSDDEAAWYGFPVKGECLSLGYPQSSQTLDDSGYVYYGMSGLYGGATSGSEGDAVSPSNVVEKAMQAQVDGDVEGFLSYCALTGATNEQITQDRKSLGTVRDNVTFSNFTFKTLATGIYDKNTVAVVRAITSYTINATESVKNGILVYLKKEGDIWKIVRIFPDDLLNQQIYEDSLPQANKLKSYATLAPSTSPLTLSELNGQLNSLLNSGIGLYADKDAIIKDSIFTGIGTVPGYGDAIAEGEQICEVAYNSGSLAQECYNHGLSAIAVSKVLEISVGILKIAVEPIPGVDATADAIGHSYSQLTYNLEIQRAIEQLRSAFSGVSIKKTGILLHPYVSKVPGYNYPDQLLTFVDIPYREYPVLSSIDVSKSKWIGLEIPLKIYGQLNFDIKEGLSLTDTTIGSDIALKLGGKKVDANTVVLPVDLTQMFDGISESVVGLPDEFLSHSTIPAKITCYRGDNPFYMTLSNDEETEHANVTTIMNKVTTLDIQTGIKDADDEDILNLYIGSTAEAHGANVAKNIKVFAEAPAETFELQSTTECLQVHIDDTGVASLAEGKPITSVTGISEGETYLSAELGNGTDDPRDSIKVVVKPPEFVEMYHGVITSAVDNTPPKALSVCLNDTGDDEYILVAENGDLFTMHDEEGLQKVGQLSNDQVQLTLEGDNYEGTIYQGNWSDGSYCSGTYKGRYLTLAEIKSLMEGCEAYSDCGGGGDALRQLIEYKESSQ